MASIISADAARQQIWDNHVNAINQKIVSSINNGLYNIAVNESEISALILNDFITFLQSNGFNTTIETTNVGRLVRIDWSTPIIPAPVI